MWSHRPGVQRGKWYARRHYAPGGATQRQERSLCATQRHARNFDPIALRKDCVCYILKSLGFLAGLGCALCGGQGGGRA